MFSITVILSVQQKEPKYYSKGTRFGAKQYTAYLQRLDSILAGYTRKPWRVSRLLEKKEIFNKILSNTVKLWPFSRKLLSKIREKKKNKAYRKSR